MDHFLLYEFVMNSLWFRRYRRNRHQIVTFVTIFSYLLMISGYYFIIRFDYMVILTIYSKFYKNTTQKIEAVLPRNRTATYNSVESCASHYTTRSLLIQLKLFYLYKIILNSDVLTHYTANAQHPLNLFYRQLLQISACTCIIAHCKKF